GRRIKRLEIFLPVVSEEGRVFGDSVFDHFPRDTGYSYGSFRKRIKSGLINFKPGPGFAVDFHPFRLDIGDAETFFPSIGRLDLLDDVLKLPARLMKVEGSLIVLGHVKGQHDIKAFSDEYFLFINRQRKKR